MDAEKVLPWLKKCVEDRWEYGRYYRPCCGFRYASGETPGHTATCKLAALIAATEHEVQTGGAWASSLPPLQVYDICIAYESGFGKGLRSSLDINPYEEGTPSYQAYGEGVKHGEGRKQTGGWKPGTEPPSHDEFVPVILTAIILDDGIPRYGRVCAKYDLRAQSWRDYFGQLRDDVMYYYDVPTWQRPLPEQTP